MSTTDDAVPTNGMNTMVTRFAVLRAGSTSPEPLRAENIDEAIEIVDRQVRSGKTPVVYLYEMVRAVCYEPSTVVFSVEDVDSGKVRERLGTPKIGSALEGGE